MIKLNFICFFVLMILTNLKAQDKNIIFFFVDDQGWSGTSKRMDSNRPRSESDFYETPELEIIAQSGVTFSQGYASAPKCSPSRNSIMLGQTSARSKFTTTSTQVNTGKFLIEPSSTNIIEDSLITFAELIKQEEPNYMTAHYGKWHLGNGGPAANGFDRGDGNTNNNNGNNTPSSVTQIDPKKIYSLTDSAITFINEAHDLNRPFYLQLSQYAVHASIEATQITITTFNNAITGNRHDDPEYGAMTYDLDSTIAVLMDELISLGIEDETYFVYMSDNGAPNSLSSNAPLNGSKTFLYEGGIRVPFIITGPNIQSDVYLETPIVGYDLYPTFIELTLGNTSTVPPNVEGVSLANLLTGSVNDIQRMTPLIFHSPHYDNNASKVPESAIVRDSFKLRVDYESGLFSLYNLEDEINESTDVSSLYTDTLEQLLIELRDYLIANDAQMPTLDATHISNTGVQGDADDDGLQDEWEFKYLLTHLYNADDDPDQDGRNNLLEITEGTDPYFFDQIVLNTNLEKDVFLEQNKVQDVTVFPNPSSSMFYYTIIDLVNFKNCLLLDSSGKELKHSKSTKKIGIRGLATGEYFLQFDFGERLVTKKVMIN